MNEEERRAAVLAAIGEGRVRHSVLIARLEDSGQAEAVPEIVEMARAGLIAGEGVFNDNGYVEAAFWIPGVYPHAYE